MAYAIKLNKFVELKDKLSGLTVDNIPVVKHCLVELGLSIGPTLEVQLVASNV